jgi:ATP-dependent Lon protease
MKLPQEVAVMTLPNATLFPQSLLPLYIFEPRYRRMLADSLDTTRMLSVAMQKPGCSRETPLPIAGLGLIRVSVGHQDGTSHLVLQGLARVTLEEPVRYRPYRVHRIRPLETPPSDNDIVDRLLTRVRQLLAERISLGLFLPFPGETGKQLPGVTAKDAQDVLGYLNTLEDPEQVADLVSCSLLSGALERQKILETVNLETRLQRLIDFLGLEIRRQRKDKNQ